MGCFQRPRIATSQNADRQACTEGDGITLKQIKYLEKFKLVPLV